MSNVMLALLLAALLGFTAQRAGICAVRAVAEVMSNRTAYFLASFVKTSLWALPISALALWSEMLRAPLAATYPMSWTALLGGGLFGFGAAVNGACAFSTLAYFAEGQLSMLASFLGYAFGVYVWERMSFRPLLQLPEPMPSLLASPGKLALIIVSLAVAWSLWESWALWRSRDRQRSWRQLLLADHYRLSVAAMIIGVCGGILYAVHGSWTYTGVLRTLTLQHASAAHERSTIAFALLLAVVAGMSVSAWQRRKLHFKRGSLGDWCRRLVGGALMGFGGSLIPGGNDEIILRAFPLLSPHALPAYFGVLAGIALGLWLLKLTARRVLHISCVGDTFKESWISALPQNGSRRVN